MRKNHAARFILLASLVGSLFLATRLIALAASYDTIADRVLGQPDFDSNAANNAGLAAAQQLNLPRGVSIIKSTGRIIVADSGNNRVMSWPNASSFSNGAAADIIFFADGISRTLSSPSQAVVDGAGALYIADTGNNRVLKFPSIVSGTAASVVLGQSNFNENQANNPSPGAQTLNAPFALALDANNNLFVADSLNSRILKYPAPITTFMSATVVIGQQLFTQSLPGNPVSASTLNDPFGLTIDGSGNLYVSDTFNNRVLYYTPPFTNGMAATRVLGQSNFTNHSGGQGSNRLSFPYGLAIDSFRRIYVADQANQRVLLFTSIYTNNMSAFQVIGQPNFISTTQNYPDFNPHAYNLNTPWGVAVESNQNFYISDNQNNRVLGYDKPSRILIFPLVFR